MFPEALYMVKYEGRLSAALLSYFAMAGYNVEVGVCPRVRLRLVL